MTAIRVQDGKAIVEDGKIGITGECCCTHCSGSCEDSGDCAPGCACDNCNNCVPAPYVGCLNTQYGPPLEEFPCQSDADCSPGCFCIYDLGKHLEQGGTLDNFFPSYCVPADICSQCNPETEECIDYDITCNQADAQADKAFLENIFSDCNSFHIITGQPSGGSIAYYVSACCPKVFP